MELSLYNIIQAITAFQFLFIATFLFTHKKGKIVSNKLFSIFLLGKGLSVLNDFLQYYAFDFISENLPIFFDLSLALLFIYSPFLLMYTKSILIKDFQLHITFTKHLIPSFLIVLYVLFKYLVTGDSRFPLTGIETIVIITLYYIQAIIYTRSALKKLRKYRDALKEIYSSTEKLEHNWLLFLLIGYLSIWIIFFFTFIGSLITVFSTSMSEILYSFGLITLLVFSNTIVFKCLRNPELLTGIEEEKEEKEKQLPKAVNEESANRLIQFMKNEEPYLNPLLSLNDLADKLEIHPRSLSLIIKHSFNKNFFDFVNSYRIEKAKEFLSDPDNENRNILEILFDSGFNSKSVFNAVFKKQVGMTPTQYRKSQLSTKRVA